MNVCFTFTSEQFDALRRVFGDRFDDEHTVDMRGRLHLPWSSYYVVLQAGSERRTELRRNGNSRVRRTLIDSALCGLSVTGLTAAASWLAVKLFR